MTLLYFMREACFELHIMLSLSDFQKSVLVIVYQFKIIEFKQPCQWVRTYGNRRRQKIMKLCSTNNLNGKIYSRLVQTYRFLATEIRPVKKKFWHLCQWWQWRSGKLMRCEHLHLLPWTLKYSFGRILVTNERVNKPSIISWETLEPIG